MGVLYAVADVTRPRLAATCDVAHLGLTSHDGAVKVCAPDSAHYFVLALQCDEPFTVWDFLDLELYLYGATLLRLAPCQAHSDSYMCELARTVAAGKRKVLQ